MLRESKDQKLQRAFILSNLPAHIEYLLDELEANKKMTEKGVFRPYTKEERSVMLDRLKGCIELIQELYPKYKTINRFYVKKWEERVSKLPKSLN